MEAGSGPTYSCLKISIPMLAEKRYAWFLLYVYVPHHPLLYGKREENQPDLVVVLTHLIRHIQQLPAVTLGSQIFAQFLFSGVHLTPLHITKIII